jgi:hypothetical protein
MSGHRICYRFDPKVSFDDVEAALLLAAVSAESLHGPASARLDLAYASDPEQRVCVLDDSTLPARDFNKLFLGLLTRDLGESAFEVERLSDRQPEPAA